jgi:hypothetical protein
MKQVYQKLIFPEGLTFDLKTKEFRTAKMSPLYRLTDTKKDAEAPSESTMVDLLPSFWNEVVREIARWHRLLR